MSVAAAPKARDFAVDGNDTTCDAGLDVTSRKDSKESVSVWRRIKGAAFGRAQGGI